MFVAESFYTSIFVLSLYYVPYSKTFCKIFLLNKLIKSYLSVTRKLQELHTKNANRRCNKVIEKKSVLSSISFLSSCSYLPYPSIYCGRFSERLDNHARQPEGEVRIFTGRYHEHCPGEPLSFSPPFVLIIE